MVWAILGMAVLLSICLWLTTPDDYEESSEVEFDKEKEGE